MVGAIEERGRLPGSTRLATAASAGPGSKAKSVSWLLRMKPSTMSREPNAFSTDVVIEAMLPSASTMTMCEVDGTSSAGIVAPELRLVPGRLAGLDVVLAERGRPADQRAARLQVGRIEQALGDVHEIAVGDVALAVGEGEARGVADDAPRSRDRPGRARRCRTARPCRGSGRSSARRRRAGPCRRPGSRDRARRRPAAP